MKTIIILSITSDIGTALAKRYLERGDKVIGTYRTSKHLEESLKKSKNCKLFYCDIDDRQSVQRFINECQYINLKWDTFISCVGNPLPLKPFFKCDFEEWNKSVHTNIINQLKVIHKLYYFRNGKVKIVFFAGGGNPNKPQINISAYHSSRVMLTRMCELIQAENKDLEIINFDPGWTKTKVHDLILENLDKNDERYETTKNFIANRAGTSMEWIFNKIETGGSS